MFTQLLRFNSYYINLSNRKPHCFSFPLNIVCIVNKFQTFKLSLFIYYINLYTSKLKTYDSTTRLFFLYIKGSNGTINKC